MHFHLPKPLHGWREFVGEVGIIVLGVLIALGAEQVVETLHERGVAAETRDTVREELDTSLNVLKLREAAEPCIGRRLNEIRGLLDQWGTTGTFKRPLWIAQAPQWNVDHNRYDAAMSAGRIALLPRDEQYHMGMIVSNLRAFNELENQEQSVWSRLRALQAAPGALSPEDRSMLRIALQDAAGLDYRARITTRQMLPEAASWGFVPDDREFRALVRQVWKTGRFTPSICASIDTPPDVANAQTGQVTPIPQ